MRAILKLNAGFAALGLAGLAGQARADRDYGF